jgi:hypothetical protein
VRRAAGSSCTRSASSISFAPNPDGSFVSVVIITING